MALAQDGQWVRVAAYIVGSVALCLAGAWLGHVLAMLINR
jgi:fluoride ion exporter CrcB/FEX